MDTGGKLTMKPTMEPMMMTLTSHLFPTMRRQQVDLHSSPFPKHTPPPPESHRQGLYEGQYICGRGFLIHCPSLKYIHSLETQTDVKSHSEVSVTTCTDIIS